MFQQLILEAKVTCKAKVKVTFIEHLLCAGHLAKWRHPLGNDCPKSMLSFPCLLKMKLRGNKHSLELEWVQSWYFSTEKEERQLVQMW